MSDISREEAVAEVEHIIAELRAGRGEIPPWIEDTTWHDGTVTTARAKAITQMEMELDHLRGSPCRSPDCVGACGGVHE